MIDSNSRTIKAFYKGKMLVGIIRSHPGATHDHIFFGYSESKSHLAISQQGVALGDGRHLTRDEFWAIIKKLNATESFVSYRS